MYGVTTTKGCMKRGVRVYGLAVAAFAALLFLSVTPAQAQLQAQLADGSVKSGVAIGLTPEQKLRVTAYNDGVHLVAGDRASEGGDVGITVGAGGVIQGHVKVLNAQGDVLFQTDRVRILPGEFHSFDIARNDLPLAGEPRTGRLQVRVKLIIEVLSAAALGQAEERETVKVASTFELIDKRSGKTTSHTEFASFLSIPGF